MPRIRRWHNISHDLNGDPEVWELTDTFGDRALRVWLEMLSIADRNTGEIPGAGSPALDGVLARRSRMTRQRVASMWPWLREKLWIVPADTGELSANGQLTVLRTRNYEKYHPSRDTNKIPQEELTSEDVMVPSFLTSPTVPNKNTYVSFSKRHPREYDPDFVAWWDNYRHYQPANKFKAHTEWQQLKKNGGLPDVTMMMNAVDEDARVEKWLEREKGKVPHARTWLHQHRWENVEERKVAQ